MDLANARSNTAHAVLTLLVPVLGVILFGANCGVSRQQVEDTAVEVADDGTSVDESALEPESVPGDGTDAVIEPAPETESEAATVDVGGEELRGVEPGAEPEPLVEPEPGPPPVEPLHALPAEALLRHMPGTFDNLLGDAEKRRLQLLIGEVVTDPATGERSVQYYEHRLNAEYFYPASAIKTVGAVGALLKIQDLNDRCAASTDPCPHVTIDTPVTVQPKTALLDGYPEQEYEVSPGTKSTLRRLIKDCLIISSNPAFCRTYDVAGHQLINERLAEAGLDSLRLNTRLGPVGLPDEVHRLSPIVVFDTEPGPLTVDLPPSEVVHPPHDMPGLLVGQAYLAPQTNERVDAPLDFSRKNYISLRDMLSIIMAVVDRDLLPSHVTLGDEINDKNRAFLREVMETSPGSRGSTTVEEREARFKPLMPGVIRVIPRNEVTYVNKAGRAYGFHIEVAYIENKVNRKGVFVATSLFVDTDGTLNDNRYAYDTISYPYFQDLGELVAREFLLE